MLSKVRIQHSHLQLELKSSSEDLLVRVKSNLNENARGAGAEQALISDLQELTALSEKLVLQRPKTSQEWLADRLDREGSRSLACCVLRAPRRLILHACKGPTYGTSPVL